jgi:hypothetical protein
MSTRRAHRFNALVVRWPTRAVSRVVGIGALSWLAPLNARAQTEPLSNLGIGGASAIGFQVGYPRVERSSGSFEAGAFLDLGWIHAPRFRLQGEVDFLRASLTERVEVEDTTFHGVFYDLTSAVSFIALAGSPTQRLVPYLTAGIGVHALSSAFGTRAIDKRYNANPFGSHVGLGLRLWLSGRGRNGAFVEARHVVAANVNRTSIRGGAMVFFRDLIRPRRP